MITVPGFSSGYLIPGIFLFTLYGGGSAAVGNRQRKHVIVGNMIGTAITGSAPTLACAAGTASTNTLTFVASADDAATYFGRGSELHRMAVRFFEQHPAGTLYGIAVPEASGGTPAAATNTLTFATAATGQATLRLYLAGEVVDVALNGTSASAVAVATFAEDVCDEINARTELPVTAQFLAGVVTITAKHVGTRGNNVEMAAEWITGTTTTPITGSATSSGAAMTCALGSAGGVLTSGAGTGEAITTALAALDGAQWFLAVAQNDSTNLATLDAWLAAQAGVLVQWRNQAVVCSRGSLSAATALAVAVNNERLQLVWHYNSPSPTEEVAAQVMAARSIGDTNAGGTLVGEESDPAANLDGLRLVHIRSQRLAADAPIATEINTALGSGLAPLAPVAGGTSALVASVTTRARDASAQPNFAVLQTSVVTSIDYCTDTIRARYSADFAGYKLTSDSPAPIKTDRTTSPKRVRSWVQDQLKGFEERAILRNVDAHADALAITEDGTMPGRLLGEIPMQVVPGLHQLAGNARQLAL